LVRSGRFGNQLIRKSEHEAQQELRENLLWESPPGQVSKKVIREKENERALGGLRNPWIAVGKNHGLQQLGARVRAAFDNLLLLYPSAVDVADTLGTEDAKEPDPNIIDEYRRLVREELGARTELKPATAEGTPSPLQGTILQEWLRQAGDPETSIGDWVREGVPLGIDREIPCCGVFPLVESEDTSNAIEDTEQLIDTSLDNYASMKVDEQDAAIEVERVVARKFASRLKKADVKKRFRKGHNSRMAVIVKVKDDGSKKRRLIVDLKRSLANAAARVPERVVLPRLGDAVWMILHMMRYHLSCGWIDPGCHPADYDLEMVTGDFSDA
jgi:hypothetical protein